MSADGMLPAEGRVMARQESITCDICGKSTERNFSIFNKKVSGLSVELTIRKDSYDDTDTCRECARKAVMEALNGNE